MSEGWGWEWGMRKTHYFKEDISLCGKWGGGNHLNLFEEKHMVISEDERRIGYSEFPDECSLCLKQLKKGEG